MTLHYLTATLSAAVLGLLPGTALAQAAPVGPRHDISEICADESCTWEKVATCSGFIEGINFDVDGTIWLTALFEGQILQLVDGECLPIGPQDGIPNGARLAPDGRLLVTDGTGRLVEIDKESGEREVIAEAYLSGQFRGLNDLTFDSEGGLYFTEPYGSSFLDRTGRVYYLPPGGGARMQIFHDGLAYPNGIAVAADGEWVYIAEFAANRVLKVPSATTRDIYNMPYLFAQLEGGQGPDGLTVDADGNLYVAHYRGGQVLVFDSEGFPYGALRLPEGSGNLTTNLGLHDGYLWLLEAGQNDVWRLPVKTAG